MKRHTFFAPNLVRFLFIDFHLWLYMKIARSSFYLLIFEFWITHSMISNILHRLVVLLFVDWKDKRGQEENCSLETVVLTARRQRTNNNGLFQHEWCYFKVMFWRRDKKSHHICYFLFVFMWVGDQLVWNISQSFTVFILHLYGWFKWNNNNGMTILWLGTFSNRY